MKYEIGKMKIAELVSRFRDGQINLIPPFQRRRVWTPRLRQKLLENMLRGKPIPAIFLYLEASGSQFKYNILDGKQRLESLLLFIANARADMAVPNWQDYFFKGHQNANFKVNVAPSGERARKKAFSELTDELVREFREYSIPTVEIMLTEEGGLTEIIDLFIDINQLGVKVNRFDIVRTMYENKRLLSDVFKLVGQRQKRRKDVFYKMVKSDYTFVLKQLQIVSVTESLETQERFQERVDRMWEKLLEIVLFIRTGQHRTLPQILKAFIGIKVDHNKLSGEERNTLKKLFAFLRTVYAQPGFKASKMATDQPHFYTMITSIHALNLVEKYGADELKKKLVGMSRIIDEKQAPPKGKTNALNEYIDISSKQTTHPGRRAKRQDLFASILDAV